jgi:hypothetical protein
MNLNLGLFIQKLDYLLGLKISKIPKFFSYNLFDKFIEKSSQKKISNNSFLKKFHEIGIVKINNSSDVKKTVDKIIAEIKNQNVQLIEGQSFYFNINNKTYTLIKDLLKINLNEYLEYLSEYFGGSIYLAGLALQRNSEVTNVTIDKNLKKTVNTKGTNASFHLDYYLCNYFKIFINLSDVDENCGPTEIIPKNKTEDYINRTGYENIYKEQTKETNCENMEYIFKNVGVKGDILFFRTANCLHRAGIVKAGHLRDTIMMTFVVDFENFNKDYFYFFNPLNNQTGEKLAKDLAKPGNFKATYNLYKRIKKKFSAN